MFPVEVEDNEFKPPEAELDEYHPKATRTLFVGNLEKEITTQMLREIFKPFGEIIVSVVLFRLKLKNAEIILGYIHQSKI